MGMWAWGDEILVGFSGGFMAPNAVTSGAAPARHPIDRTRPEQHLLARSTDGGEHWAIEHPEGLRPPSDDRTHGGRADRSVVPRCDRSTAPPI